MAVAEFEEKEFEAPLYNQLEKNTCQVWSPGQCFEKFIGFDRASFIDDPYIWQLLGHPYVRAGAVLNDFNFGFIWRMMRVRKSLPNFDLNLFIQAKRPYCHSQPPKKIHHLAAKGKCYSFSITKHQQEALERVYNRLSNRILMVYASPMFSTNNELYSHTKNGTLVQNTTFPDIVNLKGHSKWVFNKSYGIACSEPEPHIYVNIEKRIADFIEKSIDTKYNNDIDGLSILAKGIIEGLKDQSLPEMAETSLFFETIDKLHNRLRYYDLEISYRASQSLYDYFIISIFCEIFNLDWFVLGN